MLGIPPFHAGALNGSIEPDALAHRQAVIAAGGTYTAARLALNSTLIKGLKQCAAWWKREDYVFPAAEDAIQGLVTLKRRFLMTAVTFAGGDFTVDRGFTPDGSSKYFDANWIEARDSLGIMTGTNRAIGLYRATNPTGVMDHGATDGTNSLIIRPRQAGGLRGSLNSAMTVINGSGGTGMVSVQREADGTGTGWLNGVVNGAGVVLSSPVSGLITARSLFFNAANISGTPTGFSTEVLRMMLWGARLSTEENAAEYAVILRHLTAIGAN